MELPAGAPLATPVAEDVGLVLLAKDEPCATLLERMQPLPFRYTFIHHPEPQEYGWIEIYLKLPVDDLLTRLRGDETHPLAAVNVRFLPVDDAMSMSEDVLEVIDLLEATLALVLWGRAAASEEGYLQALREAVGSTLARRLESLEDAAREAALEVLLLGEDAQETPRYREGARALMAVGLATVLGTATRLLALAMTIRDRAVLLTMLSALPDSALSRAAYDRLSYLWPAPALQVTDGLRRTLRPELAQTLRLGVLEDAGLTQEQAQQMERPSGPTLGSWPSAPLSHEGPQTPIAEAARWVWRANALLHSRQEDGWGTAAGLAEEASRIFAELRENSGAATCIKLLGDVARLRGNISEALSLYQTAQRLFERAEHALGVALCAQAQAQAQDDADGYVDARRRFLQLGDVVRAARCTLALGLSATRSGNALEAWLRGRHAYAVFRAHGALADQAQACLLMGWGSHALGRYERARIHYEEAAALFQGINDSQTERECYSYLSLIANRLGAVDEEQRYLTLAHVD